MACVIRIYIALYLGFNCIQAAISSRLLVSFNTGIYERSGFATGLCPFTGRYGKRYGAAAGFVSAVLCTATTVMHGGFMLYNGGLVAGLSAMILSPLIDHYSKRGDKLEGEMMD